MQIERFWIAAFLAFACKGQEAPIFECGNGVVEGEEACDNGLANGDDVACTSACELARCGDGLLWAGVEACDDGAAGGDDAPCTSTCEIARCGDGLVRAPEEGCDDGAANGDRAACTSDCEPARCGDGLLWAGVEACDDGDIEDHDGCSAQCMLPLTIPLADTVEFVGEGYPDSAGRSVSGAGDVDGDGFADLLIGAPLRDLGLSMGAVYLIHGPISSPFSPVSLVGDRDDEAGTSVSGAGDVNGDGKDDILVGAPNNSTSSEFHAGVAYLLYGPVDSDLLLADAEAVIQGENEYDDAGFSVSGAGDSDGDGFDDILVGAPHNKESGSAYLLRGPVVGTVPLDTATAKLTAEDFSKDAGKSVSGAGDVNGDGLDDILIGAPGDGNAENLAGSTYLLYGPVAGVLSLASAPVKLTGEESYDGAGTSVSGAGDVDGDGLDDILVGAPDNGGGAAYLFSDPAAGTSSLATATAKLTAEGDHDKAGTSVSGAGDVDGDGLDDILVGAPENIDGGSHSGAVYLLYGPIAGGVPLAHADVQMVGEINSAAGGSVSGAGDVDADGRADILIGAPGWAPDVGSAYLVYGGDL